MLRRLRNGFLVLISVALCACASVRQPDLQAASGAPRPEAAARSFRVGEPVRVKLRNGSTTKVSFAAWTPLALTGVDLQSGMAVSHELGSVDTVEPMDEELRQTIMKTALYLLVLILILALVPLGAA